uniref:Endothelial differentiation-related factor 1 n=1 Tax=Canis lupus dingo TaxID=286419 RepID=A0A8C0KMS8_CANLU
GEPSGPNASHVLREASPGRTFAAQLPALLGLPFPAPRPSRGDRWEAGQGGPVPHSQGLGMDGVTLEVGKVIQQGRQSKGLTQKDLAMKINEKLQVIADYESRRAIPNNQVLGKIKRAIGLKLRGKDIGKPIEKGPRAK